MATFLEIIQIKYPENFRKNKLQPIQGESFFSSFKNNNWTRTRPIWFEHEGNRALRDGDWKLVNRYGEKWELYNISEDRTEQNDISNKEINRLKNMITKWDEISKGYDIQDISEKWNNIAINHIKDWELVRRKFVLF